MSAWLRDQPSASRLSGRGGHKHVRQPPACASLEQRRGTTYCRGPYRNFGDVRHRNVASRGDVGERPDVAGGNPPQDPPHWPWAIHDGGDLGVEVWLLEADDF